MIQQLAMTPGGALAAILLVFVVLTIAAYLVLQPIWCIFQDILEARRRRKIVPIWRTDPNWAGDEEPSTGETNPYPDLEELEFWPDPASAPVPAPPSTPTPGSNWL